MSIFKDYSAYYDMLYKNKDYRSEAEYIHQLIQQQAPNARSILNLGCGTGNHDLYLANLGYAVTGIDLSAEMIDLANQKIKGQTGVDLQFQTGDVRTIRTNKKYDVVVSLFHVVSYQVSNEDLNAAFATAAAHLAEGGVFIFDCWYGPGVLTSPPVVRHRVLENGRLRIHRIANPVMHFDENYVDVNYTILVVNKEDHSVYEIEETHKMRYLFTPEVSALSGVHGFRMDYLKGNIFSNEWNALFVCKK